MDQRKQACYKYKQITYKHAQDFKRSKKDTLWTKHQMNSKMHKGVTKQICCPNYIKEANHKRFVQQSSTNELRRNH